MKLEFNISTLPRYGNFNTFESGRVGQIDPLRTADQQHNTVCGDCDLRGVCKPGSMIGGWIDNTYSLVFEGINLGTPGCKISEKSGPFFTKVGERRVAPQQQRVLRRLHSPE